MTTTLAVNEGNYSEKNVAESYYLLFVLSSRKAYAKDSWEYSQALA